MISRLGSICSRVFYHTCPDPFVIAILLTLLTAALALGLGTFPSAAAGVSKPLALLDGWRDGQSGIWKLLSFAMQMCLILVTGHALAATKPVQRALARLSALPRSPGQAVGLVAMIACLTAMVNWGLALIVGALLARDVGLAMRRKGVRVHYPLLVAAGYTGLLVWHGGLSGSAPLSVTSRTDAARVLPAGAVSLIPEDGVPLSQTLFSPLNFLVTGGLLIGVPLLLIALTPRDPREVRTIDEFDCAKDFGTTTSPEPKTTAQEQWHENQSLRRVHEGQSPPEEGALHPNAEKTIPDRLDQSPVIAILLGLPLLAAIARFVWLRGQSLGPGATAFQQVLHGLEGVGLNEVNAVMLALGLLLHASPRAYMQAAEEGASGCAAIIVQFPLYAGIMAMMDSSGLIRQIAELFVRWGQAVPIPQGTSIPLFSYLSACIVGLFIPSGGAQWSVQGPIALQSGLAAGVPVGKMVMTVAYGDQIPNMLQPFWALPLLSITGARARDIVGYTAVVMVIAAVWIGVGLAVL